MTTIWCGLVDVVAAVFSLLLTMMFLEFWAVVLVLACYLLSATAIVYGIIAFRRADNTTHEIFALLCWLFALVALCGGCSIQILLEICRRVKSP